MIKSPPIIFFGNERLATGVKTNLPIIRSLIANNYNIVGVIYSLKDSQTRQQQTLEIVDYAKSLNIPTLNYNNVANITKFIKTTNAQLAILVAFGQIIPQTIIDLFKLGIINIHPSLLPLHRGPTPIESVILNRETITAVSIMQLVSKMDAGPVYCQKKLNIDVSITKQALSDQLADLGAKLLIDKLPLIINQQLQPIDQQLLNNLIPSYDQKITPQLAKLDFNQNCQTIDAQIRAFQFWPKSRLLINGQNVVILKTHYKLISTKDQIGSLVSTKDQLGIVCLDGIIYLDYILPAGKKAMAIKDYLRGHQITSIDTV